MSDLPSIFRVIRYGMFLARNLSMDACGQLLKARFLTRAFGRGEARTFLHTASNTQAFSPERCPMDSLIR
jgi:hypothetical protein